MAEGMLGGILGGEEEKPEVQAPDALAGAEAFASAVAAKLAGNDPQVARDTSTFLNKQSRLLDIQAKHLEDEHAARLHFLQGQAREVDIRRFGLRLRVSFQVFIVLFAIVIGIGLAVMIYDAVQSRSVVIEPFDIAPNVAAEVPSGKIVAAGLLDMLTRIQAASRTEIEHRKLSNAWTNEISIQVPETGISIGQLERTIKTRFGHDQHIDGDLAKTHSGGLALTVRGTGILPKTFAGEAGTLDKLLTQAGEYVFGQSQPGLWAAYLTENNRDDEAIRFAQSAYNTLEASEKPDVLDAWGNAISAKGGEGAMREALPLFRESVRLKPDHWFGYHDIMYALLLLGDEEGTVRVGEQMMKVAGGRPGRAPEFMYLNYDAVVGDLPALRADAIAYMESYGGFGTMGAAGVGWNLNAAQIEVLMHDVESATLRVTTTPVDEKNLHDVAFAARVQAQLAEEAGDLKAAAHEWDEAFAAAHADPTASTATSSDICLAAVTYQKTGQPGKSDAALNAVGKLTFVDCYRFRGDVLDLRGDWAGAQEWYAKAVKLAPSIPSGYYSWGLALARHGDLDAAVAKLKDANKKGPHWADPLKAWGDVLAKQGHTKEALVKYDAALKYSPNWKQLKDAREALTKQKS